MDEKNKLLIYNLTKDSRQSYSKLGKICGISKERARYRILNMEHGKPIRNFTAYINVCKLGYLSHNIYLKLHNTTERIEKKIIDYLRSHDRVDWFCMGDGKWDMLISILSKNMARFEKFMNNFEELFGKYINEKSISVLIDEYVLSHDYFVNGKRKREVAHMTADEETMSVDKTNLEIIKTLTLNSRKPLAEISRNIGMKPESVNYRIKWLRKNGIILSFRLHLDYSEIGMQQNRVFLYLNSMSEKRKKIFIQNLALIPNIIYIRNCIAPWTIEFHIISKGREDFHSLVKNIIRDSPGIVKSYEFLRVYDVNKSDYFPSKPWT